MKVAAVALLGCGHSTSSLSMIIRGVASTELAFVQSSLIFHDLGGRCQVRWIISRLTKYLFTFTFILIIQSWHTVGIRKAKALSNVFRELIVQTEDDIIVLGVLIPLV